MKDVGAQLSEALLYVHYHEVVHGDVKPENLLIDGSAAELRLADFGLAAADGGARRHGDGVPRCDDPEEPGVVLDHRLLASSGLLRAWSRSS